MTYDKTVTVEITIERENNGEWLEFPVNVDVSLSRDDSEVECAWTGDPEIPLIVKLTDLEKEHACEIAYEELMEDLKERCHGHYNEDDPREDR